MRYKINTIFPLEIIVDNDNRELCDEYCPQFFGYPNYVCGLFASKLLPSHAVKETSVYRCSRCLIFAPININIFLPVTDLNLTSQTIETLKAHDINYT